MMMREVFLLCVLAGCALHGEGTHPRFKRDGRHSEVVKPDRTWKMSKNFGYVAIAVVMKLFLLIKLALAKLAFLGNVSIMLSKLSLILSLVLTFSKYFGGIRNMLKLKSLGYDDHHQSYHYPEHQDHGGYVT